MKLILTFFLTLFLLNGTAQMRVHLINVGQGCATLIEFPCAAILVDAGGEDNDDFHSTDALEVYLNKFFSRRTDLDYTLECVYLTHPHKDHTRGVPFLLDGPFKIKNVVTDGLNQGTGRADQAKLERTAKAGDATADPSDDMGLTIVTTDLIGDEGLTDDVIDAVTCTGTDPDIIALWGQALTNPGWAPSSFTGNENLHSVVLKVSYGTSSILITGDLEDKAIETLLELYEGSDILDADVYVAGHHGSRNGTTAELLDRVSPKMALIGVGDPNRERKWTAWDHGHPNKGVLEMLENVITTTRSPKPIQAGTGSESFTPFTVNKAIYATGWDGDVVLEADNAGHWHKVGDEIVPGLININTAPAALLETLPGIGSSKAQAIVDYRNINGNFTSIDELDEVFGIGPAIIEQIRGLVTI